MKLQTFVIRPLAASALIGLLASCQSTAPSTASPTPESRFSKADTNHDGKLSRDEISDERVSKVFASRDANHDGKMTAAEWMIPGDTEGTKLFHLRDTNHDGVVTLEEALAYGRKHGNAGAILKEADKNHDGGIDLVEARAYYASKE